MKTLSTTSLRSIEDSARRIARALDGAPAPATVGIAVELGVHGAVRGATVSEMGAPYELDRLDATTIAEAITDAAGVARSGPRAWRRL